MKVPDYSLSLSFGTTVTQEKEERGAQLCPTPCDPMDCGPLGSSVHGIFSGKNAGVGCHFLLQGIFPTQESMSPASPALAGKFFTTESPRKPKVLN